MNDLCLIDEYGYTRIHWRILVLTVSNRKLGELKTVTRTNLDMA